VAGARNPQCAGLSSRPWGCAGDQPSGIVFGPGAAPGWPGRGGLRGPKMGGDLLFPFAPRAMNERNQIRGVAWPVRCAGPAILFGLQQYAPGHCALQPLRRVPAESRGRARIGGSPVTWKQWPAGIHSLPMGQRKGSPARFEQTTHAEAVLFPTPPLRLALKPPSRARDAAGAPRRPWENWRVDGASNRWPSRLIHTLTDSGGCPFAPWWPCWRSMPKG